MGQMEVAADGNLRRLSQEGRRKTHSEYPEVSLAEFTRPGFVPALLLMCRAKKRAEVSPGVGRATDIYVFEKDRSFPLNPETIASLDSYLGVYLDSVKAKWEETAERMMNDAKLFPLPVPAATR